MSLKYCLWLKYKTLLDFYIALRICVCIFVCIYVFICLFMYMRKIWVLTYVFWLSVSEKDSFLFEILITFLYNARRHILEQSSLIFNST
jgi:hypothetical protein